MANINIEVTRFECQTPVIGDTYRDSSNTGNYLFNFEWLGDLYNQYGMNATVQIFYSGDGQPSQEYTGSQIPNIAVNFAIPQLPYDTADFQLRFSVDDGNVCEYYFDIPYSSIIII